MSLVSAVEKLAEEAIEHVAEHFVESELKKLDADDMDAWRQKIAEQFIAFGIKIGKRALRLTDGMLAEALETAALYFRNRDKETS